MLLIFLLAKQNTFLLKNLNYNAISSFCCPIEIALNAEIYKKAHAGGIQICFSI